MPPAQPDQSTRERILAYLEENHVASVYALSRAWGLTRANIRYHFQQLIKEGIVEIVPRDVEFAAPRGRPAQSYRLTSQAVPDNLPQLCDALLSVLLASIEQPDKPLEAVVNNHLADGAPGTGSPVQRLNQAVAYLNQHGYKARWEAYASGPRILLRSCPYAAILAHHPELCEIDRKLIGRLANGVFQQITRQNLSTGHPPACIFAHQSQAS